MRSTTGLTPTTNTNNRGPLVNWSKQEVEKWFLDTKYKDFALNFRFLNGKELSELTEAQFKSRCPEMGDAIYNTIQKLKGKHLFKINIIIK